jgi:hypothetical protein
MYDLTVGGKCSQGAGVALALGRMLLNAGYPPGALSVLVGQGKAQVRNRGDDRYQTGLLQSVKT